MVLESKQIDNMYLSLMDMRNMKSRVKEPGGPSLQQG